MTENTAVFLLAFAYWVGSLSHRAERFWIAKTFEMFKSMRLVPSTHRLSCILINIQHRVNAEFKCNESFTLFYYHGSRTWLTTCRRRTVTYNAETMG